MRDVEGIIIDYLDSQLTNVNVYAEVPNPAPNEFVIVESTGGKYSIEAGLADASLAIQAYSTTRKNASDLARLVHGALINSADNVSSIVHASVDVPYNHTFNNTPRYQVVAQIKFKD